MAMKRRNSSARKNDATEFTLRSHRTDQWPRMTRRRICRRLLMLGWICTWQSQYYGRRLEAVRSVFKRENWQNAFMHRYKPRLRLIINWWRMSTSIIVFTLSIYIWVVQASEHLLYLSICSFPLKLVDMHVGHARIYKNVNKDEYKKNKSNV